MIASATAAGTATAQAAKTTGNAEQDLKTVAREWTEAFITGSVREIRSLQGPECASPKTVKPSVQRAYIVTMRRAMSRVLGVELHEIEIVDIELRNVTPTSGEAQVIYNLPLAKAGNDNWVEYRRHGDGWKVANCHAPIGGQSVSATSPR